MLKEVFASRRGWAMVDLVIRGAGPEMLPVIEDFKVAPNRDSIRLTLTVTGVDEANEPVSQDWQAYFIDKTKARELAARLFDALRGKDTTIEAPD